MNPEIIGTAASVVVLLSFILKGEQKIRVVNMVGCVLFITYGILIHSFSLYFLNGVLLGVHLLRLLRHKSE